MIYTSVHGDTEVYRLVEAADGSYTIFNYYPSGREALLTEGLTASEVVDLLNGADPIDFAAPRFHRYLLQRD